MPPEVRLSEVEIAKLNAEKAAIAERRAKAKAKDEEEKKKRDEANRG